MVSERFCIKEWYILEPSTGDQFWFYTYNDGVVEILTLRNNKK